MEPEGLHILDEAGEPVEPGLDVRFPHETSAAGLAVDEAHGLEVAQRPAHGGAAHVVLLDELWFGGHLVAGRSRPELISSSISVRTTACIGTSTSRPTIVPSSLGRPPLRRLTVPPGSLWSFERSLARRSR